MNLEEFAKANDTEVLVTRNPGGSRLERFKCTLAGTAVYMRCTPTPVYGYDSSADGARRTYVKIIRGKRMEFHFQTQGQTMVAVPGDLKA